jgi:uncharacterized SAM-binding protein YcdF (DUF218 family)
VLWRLFKKILKAAIVFTLLVTAVAVFAWFYPEKFLCVDSGKNVSADVIVLLGGGAREHRAERAAELFQAHAAPRILITGAGDDEMNRQILLAHGVPASAIEVEGKSTTTHENAEFSLKLLRAEKIHHAILVTSWYHSRRALKTFVNFGPELEFFSRPSYFGFRREEWKSSGVGKRLRLEFLKLPGYWIRYGVNPF